MAMGLRWTSLLVVFALFYLISPSTQQSDLTVTIGSEDVTPTDSDFDATTNSAPAQAPSSSSNAGEPPLDTTTIADIAEVSSDGVTEPVTEPVSAEIESTAVGEATTSSTDPTAVAATAIVVDTNSEVSSASVSPSTLGSVPTSNPTNVAGGIVTTDEVVGSTPEPSPVNDVTMESNTTDIASSSSAATSSSAVVVSSTAFDSSTVTVTVSSTVATERSTVVSSASPSPGGVECGEFVPEYARNPDCVNVTAVCVSDDSTLEVSAAGFFALYSSSKTRADIAEVPEGFCLKSGACGGSGVPSFRGGSSNLCMPSVTAGVVSCCTQQYDISVHTACTGSSPYVYQATSDLTVTNLCAVSVDMADPAANISNWVRNGAPEPKQQSVLSPKQIDGVLTVKFELKSTRRKRATADLNSLTSLYTEYYDHLAGDSRQVHMVDGYPSVSSTDVIFSYFLTDASTQEVLSYGEAQKLSEGFASATYNQLIVVESTPKPTEGMDDSAPYWISILCIVGGVMLIGIIVLVVICFYKRALHSRGSKTFTINNNQDTVDVGMDNQAISLRDETGSSKVQANGTSADEPTIAPLEEMKGDATKL